jgi:DNA-binding NarL/FixJ family response regulator
MTPVRVLVIDDHPVYRRGMASLLDASGYVVVGEGASAAEAVELARRLTPDVVLMDLGLPDASGVEATGRITGADPKVRVVVVTMHDDEGSVRRALEAGAAGYVVKDAPPAELVAIIEAARLGAVVLGSRVAYSMGTAIPDRIVDPWALTPREGEIASLVERGLTNGQIAQRLGLSGKTVSNNVSTILMKCGAADRFELAGILRGARE